MSSPCIKANAALDVALEAIPVVLHLMQPVIAARRVGGRSRQGRFDKTGKARLPRTAKRSRQTQRPAIEILNILTF